MKSPESSGVDRLCAEITALAQREAEAILAKAHADRTSALARAETIAREETERELKAARAEACRQREHTMAMVPVEIARLRAEHLDNLLANIRARVQQQLGDRTRCGSRQTLIELAVDAIRRMDSADVIVAISTDDAREHGAALRETIADALGPHYAIALAVDPTIKTGVMVRDRAGRQEWDNRLEARLERMWPDLRVQLVDALKLRSGDVP